MQAFYTALAQVFQTGKEKNREKNALKLFADEALAVPVDPETGNTLYHEAVVRNEVREAAGVLSHVEFCEYENFFLAHSLRLVTRSRVNMA